MDSGGWPGTKGLSGLSLKEGGTERRTSATAKGADDVSLGIADLFLDSKTPDQLTNQYYDLFKAAREGEVDTIRRVLKSAKLDINHQDKDGDTALHRAAAGQHLQVAVMLVVEFSANLDLQNKSGVTPLMASFQNRSPNLHFIKFLLDSGAALPNVSSSSLQGSVSSEVWSLIEDSHKNPIRHLILRRAAKEKALKSQVKELSATLQGERQSHMVETADLKKSCSGLRDELKTTREHLIKGTKSLHEMQKTLTGLGSKGQTTVKIAEVLSALQRVNLAYGDVRLK